MEKPPFEQLKSDAFKEFVTITVDQIPAIQQALHKAEKLLLDMKTDNSCIKVKAFNVAIDEFMQAIPEFINHAIAIEAGHRSVAHNETSDTEKIMQELYETLFR